MNEMEQCYLREGGQAGNALSPRAARAPCQLIAGASGRPATWGPLAFAQRGTPAESLARRLPPWRPRGLRVLLSDLLWEGDPLQLLATFADRATAVVVVQLLAQAD